MELESPWGCGPNDYGTSLDFQAGPNEAHGDFVIVDQGRQFFVVDNEDGWAAGGIGMRI